MVKRKEEEKCVKGATPPVKGTKKYAVFCFSFCRQKTINKEQFFKRKASKQFLGQVTEIC